MTRNLNLIIILSAIIAGSFVVAKELGQQAEKKSRPAPATEDSEARIRLLVHDEGGMVLEWTCPPFVALEDSSTGAVTGLEIPGAIPLFETGVPALVQLQQMFDALPGDVQIQILEEDIETKQLGRVLVTPEDVVVDMRDSGDGIERERDPLDQAERAQSYLERSLATPKKAGMWPERTLVQQEAGVFRGHRMVSVMFFPLRVNAETGQVRFTKRLKFRVRLPEGEGEARLPDRLNETRLVQNLLGDLSATALPNRMPEEITERQADSRLDDDPIGGRIKLFVDYRGITRVTSEWLTFQLIDYSQISTNDLHVKMRGHEIPVHFRGGADNHWDEGDYLEFYSVPNESTYTWLNRSMISDPWANENVYWLSWGDGVPGMRLAEQDGAWHPEWRVTPITSVRSFVHVEKNQRFDRLGEQTDYNSWLDRQLTLGGPLAVYYDHWFFGARIDARTTRDHVISLPAPNLESLRPVFVRACLNGASYGVGNFGQHRAIVYLNGHTERGLAAGRIAGNPDTTGSWSGQLPVIVESNPDDPNDPGISGQDLFDGDNIISVTLPGDGPGGDNDKIYANWFQVEYDRQTRAAGGTINFRIDTTRGDTFSFDLRGFATRAIQVWKLGEARLVNPDIRFASKADEGESYWVRFPYISDGGYDFYAFEDRAVMPPLRAEWEISTRDLRTMTGAEYLMIAHERFRSPELDPSIVRLDSMRRASFNGSADTIWAAQIFEQFNWGIVNPEAIRNFLIYAYEHWPVRPTHACIIGDGIAQWIDNTSGGNMIPPFFPVTKKMGISACDGIFGLVSGPPWDLLPDLAIGRISARTPSELATYVDKVYQYEVGADFSSRFRSTFLFVADQRDELFNFVRDFAEPTIRQTPDNINIDRVYLDSLELGEGPTALRDAFRNGATVVNYNGHGGGGVWSGTSLIDVAGVRLLTNRNLYPFIANFTCYVGAFDDRDQALVLGEAFMFNDNNSGFHVGAIGVYSSSGVGWANEGVFMQRFMFDFLGREAGMTIGEIVQLGKARHWGASTGITGRLTNGVPYYMQMMMNLLGDPGLTLDLPREQFAPEIQGDNYVIQVGDSMRVVGQLPWDPQGDVVDLYIRPYNGDYFTLERSIQGQDTVFVRRFVSAKAPAFHPDLDFAFTEQIITEQNFVSQPLPISTRFVTPRGTVVVYANQQNQRRDVVGFFPVFVADELDSVQYFDVSAIPRGFVVDDSVFRIQVTVLHRDELEQVRFRGIYRPPQGPLVIDTLNMTEVTPGVWQTPRDLGPYDITGSSYRVTFFGKPLGGDFEPSQDYTIPLEGRPDFSVQQVQPVVPRLESGTRADFVIPILYSKLPNAQEVDAIRVRVDGYRDSLLTNGSRVVVDSFSTIQTVADPAQYTSLFEHRMDLYLRPGNHQLRVRLDPENLIAETNEGNNTYLLSNVWATMFPASNALGTYYLRPTQGHVLQYYTSETDALTDTIFVRIAPGSFLTDSATIVYSGPTYFPEAEAVDLAQGGLRNPYPTPVSNRYFHVMLGDSSEYLAPDAEVNVQFYLTGIADTMRLRHLRDIAIFQRRSESGYWQLLENTDIDTFITQPFRGRITGRARSLGDFALFYYIDEVGPRISFTVAGERFTRFSYVPRRPEIFINFEDIGGIDRSPGRHWLILDGDTIPPAEIGWSDSLLAGGMMSAVVRPDLEPGVHTMEAYGTDNAGNATTATAEFNVSGDFGIPWAINYPNPFRVQTTISFVLTDLATDFVEIKIYTVAGRHIRTLRSIDNQLANYQFLIWDGLDDGGEEVANGVYFGKIIVKHDDEKIEKIVKMAKVR